MRYFVLIELPKRKKDAYGVVVSDIPGCFSAGDTADEALANAEEAIIMQLEDILDRGGTIPEPSSLESIINQVKPGWACFGVAINRAHISTKAARVNVTIPEGVLAMIDEAAEREHKNRSAFLTDAALEKINKVAQP